MASGKPEAAAPGFRIPSEHRTTPNCRPSSPRSKRGALGVHRFAFLQDLFILGDFFLGFGEVLFDYFLDGVSLRFHLRQLLLVLCDIALVLFDGFRQLVRADFVRGQDIELIELRISDSRKTRFLVP